MIWILLRTFLAWGSARLIKKKVFKTDFNKPLAIILAIIWGIIWGIAAAFGFEYIFGVGIIRSNALVPSMLFTSVAAYQALIAKDFIENPRENVQAPFIMETESTTIENPHKLKALRAKRLLDPILFKSRVIIFLLLTTAIIVFILILLGRTNSIKSEITGSYKKLQIGNKSANVSEFDSAMGLFNSGNYEKANELFQQLAIRGDARAQFTLALMYGSGQGVQEDHKQSVDWCKKAAEQGLVEAQNFLGKIYENGIGGVNQDYKQAVEWYRKAAFQGYPEAQSNLGIMYYLGQGITQDYGQAIVWFKKAAMQGNRKAQYDLGWMYSSGEGVSQDFIRSHMWANLAAAKGEDGAIKLRDILAKKMTQTQIAEAQRLASECEKNNYKNCD